MARKPTTRASISPGPGVDAQGLPVIDPTANVMDIISREVVRLNDVRAEQIKRIDDLRENNSSHLKETMALRARYEELLRTMESKRIDAIRAVDVAAVQQAAQVQAAQATALAAQVATSAEAMRSQVAAAATASTTALAAALEPIQKDVADLRRVQYEQQGQRVAQVEYRGDRGERRDSSQWAVGLAVSTLIGLIVVAIAVFAALHK